MPTQVYQNMWETVRAGVTWIIFLGSIHLCEEKLSVYLILNGVKNNVHIDGALGQSLTLRTAVYVKNSLFWRSNGKLCQSTCKLGSQQMMSACVWKLDLFLYLCCLSIYVNQAALRPRCDRLFSLLVRSFEGQIKTTIQQVKTHAGHFGKTFLKWFISSQLILVL